MFETGFSEAIPAFARLESSLLSISVCVRTVTNSSLKVATLAILFILHTADNSEENQHMSFPFFIHLLFTTKKGRKDVNVTQPSFSRERR